MKKMKRLFAVLLAMAMVLGLSVTAFAAQFTATASTNDVKDDTRHAEGTAADKGTITISGLGNPEASENSDMTISLYPIVKATYNNPGKLFSGYEEVYKDKLPDGTTYLDIDNIAVGGSVALTETSTAYLNAVKDYIDQKKITTDLTKTVKEKCEKDKFNSIKISDVPVGMYLVLITNAEKNIYSPAVVSVYYSAVTGEGDVTTGNQFIAGEVNLVGQNAWMKKSDHPTIDKKIKDSNGTDNSNSVHIGDEVPYEVKVTPIPYYGGKYPVFEITDTLDKGLTYQKNMVVEIYGTDDKENAEKTLRPGTDFTYNDPVIDKDTGKTTISLNFVVDGQYKLNTEQGKELRLTYSAVLNKDATVNQIANVNNVKLEYTRDSKVNGGDITTTVEDETYTYTFDIDAAVEGSVTNKVVTKVGEIVTGEDPTALEGAVFGLYTDADCKTFYTNKDQDGTVLFDGRVTSDKYGQLKIKGLKAIAKKDGKPVGGTTYYLKEITAPSGYSLNTNTYMINIVPTYGAGTSKDDARITQWTITVSLKGTTTDTVLGTNTFSVNYVKNTEGKVIDAEVRLNGKETPVFNNGTLNETEQDEDVNETPIPNTKLVGLPSTGGMGTMIFTVAGCLIMIVAAAFYFSGRKKSAAK